jgi:hypothetical protein
LLHIASEAAWDTHERNFPMPRATLLPNHEMLA